MKVYIQGNERYPDYSVGSDKSDGLYEIDVTKETFERWQKASEQYDACQEEMSEYFRAANRAWSIKSGYQKE